MVFFLFVQIFYKKNKNLYKNHLVILELSHDNLLGRGIKSIFVTTYNHQELL